jgi:integrase
LQQTGRLDLGAEAGRQIDPDNVDAYLADLKGRVSTVSAYNAISKLRRVGKTIAPTTDWKWLNELEQDLRLVAMPRSKFDRLVMTDRLVEAGLTLIVESNTFADTRVARAKGIRNGLMIAILAVCPIRLKNLAALEIGSTFREIEGSWWIVLSAKDTKSRRADERRLPDFLKPYTDLYLSESRPMLLRPTAPTSGLWPSTVSGRPMLKKAIGTLVSKITLETLGVDVSPHLFRTAAASTVATYGSNLPSLASALLNHTDTRITEEHYNRATSMSAAETFADSGEICEHDSEAEWWRHGAGSRPAKRSPSGRLSRSADAARQNLLSTSGAGSIAGQTATYVQSANYVTNDEAANILSS